MPHDETTRFEEMAALHDASESPLPLSPTVPIEIDPVFAASEAAKFVPGDKAKYDDLIAIIADLQARVTALENLTPAGYAATGFGDARCNGALTEGAERYGSPTYRCAGGGFIQRIPGQDGWEFWEADPQGQMYTALYRTNGPDITSPWYPVTGAGPAGTIS